MTTYAWDIPGWLAGHRFTDDPRYYSASEERFIDMAGYCRQNNNGVDKLVGTPVFAALGANNRRGLLLNNSNKWKFLHPIPWEGTMLVVTRPTLVSSSVTLNTWRFGSSSTIGSNPLVRFLRSSGVNTMRSSGNAGTLSATSAAILSANIYVMAFSWSQQVRKIRHTRDGSTIIESAAEASAINSNTVAPGGGAPSSGGIVSEIDGRLVFLGDNAFDTTAGTPNVPNATDFVHVFEQHFWKGDVLSNYLTTLAAFMADRRTYYAATA